MESQRGPLGPGTSPIDLSDSPDSYELSNDEGHGSRFFSGSVNGRVMAVSELKRLVNRMRPRGLSSWILLRGKAVGTTRLIEPGLTEVRVSKQCGAAARRTSRAVRGSRWLRRSSRQRVAGQRGVCREGRGLGDSLRLLTKLSLHLSEVICGVRVGCRHQHVDGRHDEQREGCADDHSAH